jgi:hypothetical protein
MRDNKYIIQQVSDVVDDGYRINVSTSAWLQHLTYNFGLELLNLGQK